MSKCHRSLLTNYLQVHWLEGEVQRFRQLRLGGLGGEEKEKDKVHLEPAKVKNKSVDFGFR
jgi:hypothetical protein